jgi:hypothetical protein
MAEQRFSSVPQKQDTWDKIWRDRRGNVVIWQRPNIFIIAWVIITVVTIFTTGTVSNVLWYISAAVLAIWALLEIFRGVNYFRRFLGVLVALIIIAAFFKVGY